MDCFALQRQWLSSDTRLAGAALTGFAICPIAAPAQAQLAYAALGYGLIPNSGGETGGVLYSLSAGTWTAFPVAADSDTNFPGTIGSSRYGPSFDSQHAILNAVGGHKTQSSSPYDFSYLYDGAAASGEQLTTLASYANNNFPGAVGTTFYGGGVNLIAGGYLPLDPGGLDRKSQRTAPHISAGLPNDETAVAI